MGKARVVVHHLRPKGLAPPTPVPNSSSWKRSSTSTVTCAAPGAWRWPTCSTLPRGRSRYGSRIDGWNTKRTISSKVSPCPPPQSLRPVEAQLCACQQARCVKTTIKCWPPSTRLSMAFMVYTPPILMLYIPLFPLHKNTSIRLSMTTRSHQITITWRPVFRKTPCFRARATVVQHLCTDSITCLRWGVLTSMAPCKCQRVHNTICVIQTWPMYSTQHSTPHTAILRTHIFRQIDWHICSWNCRFRHLSSGP